jgi:hypothetical protein
MALTAFAVQACSGFLVAESQAAMGRLGGLHAHILHKPAEGSVSQIKWSDPGDTIRGARESLKSVQQLTFHFLKIIAEPTPCSRKGVITVCESHLCDNLSCFKLCYSHNLTQTSRLLLIVSLYLNLRTGGSSCFLACNSIFNSWSTLFTARDLLDKLRSDLAKSWLRVLYVLVLFINREPDF